MSTNSESKKKLLILASELDEIGQVMLFIDEDEAEDALPGMARRLDEIREGLVIVAEGLPDE